MWLWMFNSTHYLAGINFPIQENHPIHPMVEIINYNAFKQSTCHYLTSEQNKQHFATVSLQVGDGHKGI